MPPAEIILTLAPLHTEPSPNGGVRFASSHDGRSVFGVVRRIPGRMVHVRDEAGVRTAVGWTAIDDEADVVAKAADLMLWASTGWKNAP